MSIPENIIQRLKQNWEDRESGLPVYALVRYFIPGSKWECYLYAMNPDDTEQVRCVMRHSGGYADEYIIMSDLDMLDAVVDAHYRPRQVDTILTQDNKKPWENQ